LSVKERKRLPIPQ